ncbi:hypothetical protein [Caedibacter taeniospiralis]|jgi:hypothetical protein|uniref:hypothetical protein n=1 Tax=Caedibacter taeniospiralis TaxID=28907 RepID=UPI0037BFE292
MLENAEINTKMPELEEQIFQEEDKTKKQTFKFSPIYFGYLFGALVLIFGGYTLLHKVVSGTREETPQGQNTGFDFSVANHQTIGTSSDSSQMQAVQTNNSLSPALSHDLDDKLNNLLANAENILKNQKTIVMNQSGSKDLQVTNTKSLESQIYILDQKIDALTKQFQAYANIQSDFEKLQQSLKYLLAQQTSQKTPLSVIAMLEGKAWVKTQDDKTIFLTLDSEIKGYGKVVKIDPGAGKIFMSSGFVIS